MRSAYSNLYNMSEVIYTATLVQLQYTNILLHPFSLRMLYILPHANMDGLFTSKYILACYMHLAMHKHATFAADASVTEPVDTCY